MNLAHDAGRVIAHIADAPVKQTDVVGSGIRGHDCLVVRHATDAVDLYSILPKLVDDTKLFPTNGDLDIDVLVIAKLLKKLLGLGDHLPGIGRRHLDANRDVIAVALHQVQYPLDMLAEVRFGLFGERLLGENGRVGGDAYGEATRKRLRNIFQVGGV